MVVARTRHHKTRRLAAVHVFSHVDVEIWPSTDEARRRGRRIERTYDLVLHPEVELADETHNCLDGDVQLLLVAEQLIAHAHVRLP
jgi:hypothetical protein